MKVRTILDIVRKLMPILEYYRDWNILDMLDDIYQKSCSNKPAEMPGALPAQKTKVSEKLSPRDAAALIITMNKEERSEFLKPYYVRELKEIADCLQLKYKSNIRRPEIIELIASYEKETSSSDSIPAEMKLPQEDRSAIDYINEAAARIVNMQQEDIISYLNSFTKKDILAVARQLNLKLSANYTKNNLILMIAKHIGFKEVNRRIAQRPRVDRF